MLSSIQDILPRLQEIADGNKTTFVADFPLLDQNFVLVYLNDSKSESGFSVDSESNSVIFDTAPESGTIVTIVRAVPTSWEDTGNSRGAMDKDAFDRTFTFLVCKMQTLKEELSRCLKTPMYSDKSGEQLSEFFLTQLTDALDVLDRAQDSLSLIQSTSSSALSSISDALDNALSQIEGKVTAAGASADRAEQEADRAQTIVDSAVDNINTARDEALAQLNPERFYTKEEANGTFVALKGNQTASGDKTWTGTQNFNNAVNLATGKGIVIKGTEHNFHLRSTGSPSEGAALLLDNDPLKYAFNAFTSRIAIGSAAVPPICYTPSSSASGEEIVNAKWVLNKISQSKPKNVVDYTRITNCLTEIPQDIKLELAGTALTATGNAYIPNGAGNFEKININLTKEVTFTGAAVFVFYIKENSQIAFQKVNLCTSGTMPPTGTGSFYNTTLNVINGYTDGSTDNRHWSYPLGILSADSSGNLSIDQVFNGFGYIGNNTFVLPGVKCLRTNGFNTDGSLNSIETTFKYVIIPNFDTVVSRTEYYIKGDNSVIAIDPETYTYDSTKNIYIYNPNGSYHYLCFAYSVTKDSTGRITSLTPNTAFHAVDYSEYAREVGRCAKLDESNVFTGSNNFVKKASFKPGEGLEILGTDANYRIRSTGVPANGCALIRDNDPKDTYWNASNENILLLGTRLGNIKAVANYNINNDENSDVIPSTAWVNRKFQVVSTLPAEPDTNVHYLIPEE